MVNKVRKFDNSNSRVQGDEALAHLRQTDVPTKEKLDLLWEEERRRKAEEAFVYGEMKKSGPL